VGLGVEVGTGVSVGIDVRAASRVTAVWLHEVVLISRIIVRIVGSPSLKFFIGFTLLIIRREMRRVP
jgi:hypothetical protein